MQDQLERTTEGPRWAALPAQQMKATFQTPPPGAVKCRDYKEQIKAPRRRHADFVQVMSNAGGVGREKKKYAHGQAREVAAEK